MHFSPKVDSFQKKKETNNKIAISSVSFIQCNTCDMHITTFVKVGWSLNKESCAHYEYTDYPFGVFCGKCGKCLSNVNYA